MISYAQSINEPTIAAPGQVFDYGPVPFQIFGEALSNQGFCRPTVKFVDPFQDPGLYAEASN